MLRQISLVPARASRCSETTRLGAVLRQRFHSLVPGDGRSASRTARQQYSRHDGFVRYAAEDRLLTEPIQPLQALQGRKISLYLCKLDRIRRSGVQVNLGGPEMIGVIVIGAGPAGVVAARRAAEWVRGQHYPRRAWRHGGQ